MPADPKQGPRIIDKSAIERKMMDELQCRACGPNGTGRLEAHHLVNRSQLGDDVEANIVALCPVCHFTFTHEGGNSARVVARRIRSNLSQSERGYIIKKKSFEWLEQHYPRFEASDRTGWPVLSEGEDPRRDRSRVMPMTPVPPSESTPGSGPAITGAGSDSSEGETSVSGVRSGSIPDGGKAMGGLDPTSSSESSAEPRNREVREGHPSVLVSSADKPGGVEQPGMAAPPSGADYSNIEVPPGRFDLTDEQIAELPVLDLSEMLSEGDKDDGEPMATTSDTSPSESIPTVTPYWLEPGVDCPTCHRKIPHKKKDSTPKSKTWGFKIPEDEREAFETNLESVEKIIGVYERPYAHFQTVVAMLGYILMNHEDEFRRFLSK